MEPIDFKYESLVECYMEIDALVHDYFATTKAHEDVPPLEFNWPHYLALEHQRMLLLVTARSRSQLAGFVLYIVMPHPHHKTTIVALCDMLSVRPSFRGLQIARNLMGMAEPRLRDRNVDRVMHMFRATYADDTVPLFSKLGYEVHETTYMKLLGH